GMEPTLDDVLHGENKNKIEKKKAEFIVVSTDDEGENLVVKVDDLKHEKVYEDWVASKTDPDVRVVSEGLDASSDGVETSEVGKDESVEEETKPTEVNAGGVPCEEELGDEPSKAVAIEDVNLDEEVPTPFADAPPPYVAKVKDESMEEPPAPFADAPPPYEWGDEEYDLSDCLFSNWTVREALPTETVKEDGTVPPEVETVLSFDRLFSDEELDAMENGEPGQEASILSGTVVAPEPEEYNKELEDRLYPLDEVELHKRVAKNAEAQAEPSSEDLARLLGISLEVVERTRQASPDLHGSPEYWQNWFEEMLDKSEEAKRANRDFRSPVVSVVYGPAVEAPARPKKASSVESGSYVESVPSSGDKEFASEARVTVESVRTANVERPPDDPRGAVAVVEAVPVLSKVRGVDSKVARAVARQAVFRFLQEARSYENERLLWHADSVKELTSVNAGSGEHLRSWMRTYFDDNSWRIWLELWDRAGLSKTPSAKRRRRRRRDKVVAFDFSSLYKPYAEVMDEVEFFPERDEDASHYVEVVRIERPARTPLPKTGLVDVVTVDLPNGFGVYDDEDAEDDAYRAVEDGRRVVCAVGNFEALSSGYNDCLPSQMLADTGATLSLVDRRVLKRLGRASEPLEPYERLVRSSSGHKLRIRGWISLAFRLGTVEVSLSVLVADRLHVDAILGVDALGAFGAVIDVADRTLTLKSSGEVLSLGFTMVQESYMTAMATSVRLPPLGQALVTTRVVGTIGDKSIVLVEGSLGLPPTLCVARSLGTVEDGQVIVEVCNASTDEYWIRKGTVIASTSVIPESTFESATVEQKGTVPADDQEPGVERAASVSEARKADDGEKMKASKPDVPPDKAEGMEADFSESKLSPEQKELFQAELNGFRNMFVDSSKEPGRTDLLQFEIDTGNSSPIKQPPYRVSLAEGEVMEAEVQQYLELNLIRPSNSPWASPVLMIRKPDGGIRFCIDDRKLNAVTVKDCYPMPLIDDILNVLGDAQLFSTMDIASGYWNVPMHPDSVSKTAFTCKYGLYEWLVMPFGLCNAVPAFERLMETVLVDLKWRICLVYLDDCVIFSKDFPTHLVRVRQVLTRFQQAGFKLKMKKCHWGRSQVAFL
ncbi:hypothetical protein PR003_g23460, partial [Phytophthora rubi]